MLDDDNYVIKGCLRVVVALTTLAFGTLLTYIGAMILGERKVASPVFLASVGLLLLPTIAAYIWSIAPYLAEASSWRMDIGNARYATMPVGFLPAYVFFVSALIYVFKGCYLLLTG